MRNRKYRAVVAAVLVGAVLFSPLLCGMTCIETGGRNSSAAAKVAPAAGEFVGEFVESGVVGCVLTHVVFDIDWSDWAGVLEDGTWVWVGVEAVRLTGVVGWRGE
jgi:hypothetical protein